MGEVFDNAKRAVSLLSEHDREAIGAWMLAELDPQKSWESHPLDFLKPRAAGFFQEATALALTLPEREQDAIGASLLGEIESERTWNELFLQPSEQLAHVAWQSLSEYANGRTHRLDLPSALSSHTTENFEKLFVALPTHVDGQARSAYVLYRTNPADPRLNAKRLTRTRLDGPNSIISIRVARAYRALGLFRGGSYVVWFWIGNANDFARAYVNGAA